MKFDLMPSRLTTGKFFFSLVVFSVCAVPTFSWAKEWSDLERFQRLRSKTYVEAALEVLIKQDQDALADMNEHLVIEDQSFKIFNSKADSVAGVAPEFEYFFDKTGRDDANAFSRQKTLKDVRIVLDPNDGRWGLRQAFEAHESGKAIGLIPFIRKMTASLEHLLNAEGAITTVLRPEAETEYSYHDIAQAAQSNQPQIVISLSFGLVEPARVVTFVPGCFMAGELEPGENLQRLAYALVSGKLYESSKLAHYISHELAAVTGTTVLEAGANDFDGNACPVSANTVGSLDPSASAIHGIAARNLFIQSVHAPAVIYTYPPMDPLFTDPSGDSLDLWAEKLGQAYFIAIKKYVEKDGVPELLPKAFLP